MSKLSKAVNTTSRRKPNYDSDTKDIRMNNFNEKNDSNRSRTRPRRERPPLDIDDINNFDDPSLEFPESDYASLQSSDLCTLEDLFEQIYDKFENSDLTYGQGTVDAAEDATFLLTRYLSLPIDKPLIEFADKSISPRDVERILKTADLRIKSKKPLAYMFKSVIQHGHLFYCDERVIIPRSYLAEIISDTKYWPEKYVNNSDLDGDDEETVFKMPKNGLLMRQNVKGVLDLCTGSGYLSILAALAFPNAEVIHATDLSPEALEVSKINIVSKKLDTRISIYQGNLFEALLSDVPQYDLIICNPPYVDQEDMKVLPEEYNAEPRLALDGGLHGLELIEKILQAAPDYLKDGGGLLLEVGTSSKSLLKKYPGIFRSNTTSGKKKKSAAGMIVSKKEEKIVWISTKLSENEVFFVTKSVLINFNNLRNLIFLNK